MPNPAFLRTHDGLFQGPSNLGYCALQQSLGGPISSFPSSHPTAVLLPARSVHLKPICTFFLGRGGFSPHPDPATPIILLLPVATLRVFARDPHPSRSLLVCRPSDIYVSHFPPL